MRLGFCSVFAAALLLAADNASAQQKQEIDALRAEVRELRRRDEENRRRIEELSRVVERLAGPQATAAAPTSAPTASSGAATSPQDALSRALGESGAGPAATVATEAAGSNTAQPPAAGGTNAYINLSFDILTSAGGSTAHADELEDLQFGGHDPHRNGFTFQQGELSLTGAVDPYFSGEAHLIASEHGVELEEAFLLTSSLPWGLQLEAGYSFLEFGQLNPRHPHEWDFLDVPVINARLLGPEGLRSAGARLGWLLPVPWASELHVGIANADNEDLTASFVAGEPVGGRPAVDRDVHGLDELLYLMRWTNSVDAGDTTALLGISGLTGPNDTGSDGRTWIYGADLKMKWVPASNFRGYPYVLWQTEVMGRSYEADASDDGTVSLPSDTLHDWGIYTQALWGFRPRWSAGLRAEYADGNGRGFDEDGISYGADQDPLRSTRWRLSPLLAWTPSHFSRLRLQYNYDNSDSLSGRDAHTFWLGIEVGYGAHSAHKF